MTEPGNASDGSAGWRVKFATTLNSLAVEPGFLTEEWLAGRRARWLRPFAVFLFCTGAYFITDPLVTRVVRVHQVAAEAMPFPPDARSALEAMGARERLGDDRFNRIVADIGALSVKIGGTLGDAAPRIMFAFMPLFALLTWLAWRDTLRRYSAHLTLSLHVHAAWFGSMAVASLAPLTRSSIIDVLAGLAVLVYSTWYCGVAFKRVLGGTSMQLFARTTIVGVVYAFGIMAAMLATIAFAILTY